MRRRLLALSPIERDFVDFGGPCESEVDELKSLLFLGGRNSEGEELGVGAIGEEGRGRYKQGAAGRKEREEDFNRDIYGGKKKSPSGNPEELCRNLRIWIV